MTNIVVTGGERYKSESTSGGVRVKRKYFASLHPRLPLCVACKIDPSLMLNGAL